MSLAADYDPVAYWAVAGEIYEATNDPSAYRRQEAEIATLLEPLAWETALDVGCGFGRLGELLRRIRPSVALTGIDVSPHQIAAARRRLPDAELHETAILDFDAGGRTWDLVVSAEVLMHQPDRLIRPTVERMLAWAKGGYLLSCDWDIAEEAWQANWWNRCHDYRELYGRERIAQMVRLDRQTIWLVDCR